MRTQLTRLAVVISATAGVSTAAFAIDPHNIRVSDGVMFTPTLQIEERHDDNIFGTDKKRQSSWVTVIEPTFKLSLDRAKSAHELKYRISSKSIHSSSSNSYVDHHITANSGFEFDARNRLLLNAGYHKLQNTATDVGYRADPKNDKWNSKNIGGVYTFGSREAITQVDFGLNYDELRYDNSQHDGNGERIHKEAEHDAASARLTGYYAITPRTKLLLEGRYTDYDYKSNNDRDSKNKALLAGVTWSATAKTTGTVKVGREKKDYKNSSSLYKNNSTAMWEAGIQWAPVSYSTFNLRTRRGFEEGSSYTEFDDLDQIDNVTNNVKVVDSSLAWKHYWMDRFYSATEYRRIDRKYQGTKEKRDDKIDQYALGLNYEAYRWLDVGVNFKHRDNDSDVAVRNYKRNIYALTFSASL